jgi:hypothetical protein
MARRAPAFIGTFLNTALQNENTRIPEHADHELFHFDYVDSAVLAGELGPTRPGRSDEGKTGLTTEERNQRSHLASMDQRRLRSDRTKRV